MEDGGKLNLGDAGLYAVCILMIGFVGVSMFIHIVDGAEEIRTGLMALLGVSLRDLMARRDKASDENQPVIG